MHLSRPRLRLQPRRLAMLLALGAAAAFAAPAQAGLRDGVPVQAQAAPAGASTPAIRQPVLSSDARTTLDWVRAHRDNGTADFAIVDKKAARVHVFDAQGDWKGSSPILLGRARGDDSVPGIGTRKMSEIRPHERTTPAGRFVSEPGRNLQGEDIVWVDYDAAVSMHRVRATNKAERRLERLATATIDDNRISWGCINVPAAFYDAHVKPALGGKPGIVYVLPETRPVATLFGTTTAAAPR